VISRTLCVKPSNIYIKGTSLLYYNQAGYGRSWRMYGW
jgi:hypothetical protein